MNINSFFESTPRIGRLLATTAAVFAIGLLNPPAVEVAMAATIIPVAVDQSPLTLRQPIPPDITLMLDDSGSMNWDFMPDAQYLSGSFTGTDEYGYQDVYIGADALRSASMNGTYFNPNITYTVPVQANGTTFPTPTNLAGYFNPFSSTATTVDVTKHLSPWLCDYNGWQNTSSNCPNSLYYAFPYYTAFPSATSGTNSAYQPTCSTGTLQNGFCYSTASGFSAPTCKSTDSYNSNTWWCEKGTPTYTYLFTYTTPGSTAGTYARHYIGKSSAACSAAPSGTCVYDTASQQNVAVWFSYYRKRILMAKSGLLTAFNKVNPSFRIGFGSIDGNNIGGMPTAAYSYNDVYNSQTNYIAQVAPFDTNCASNPMTCTSGQIGTQRANFWSWVQNESAGGGTPLRQALDQVGQYYQTSQPWTTMSTDPGYGLADQPSNIACRQAYAILTTDGFWNENFTGPGNADGTNGATVIGPNGQSFTYTASSPYADGYSNTLADVAMKYWETDLQPSIINSVPPSTNDPAFWQHMTTFTIGLGFTPTGITPAGTTMGQVFNWANGGVAISGFAWPMPAANSIYNIADLAHAGVNGHGGFYSATDPTTFVSGLSAALNRATDRVGTGASLAANSTQLQTGTAVFQANYYTGNWKGDLKELAVNANDGTIAINPTWSAEKQLASNICQPDPNTIGAIVCDSRTIQSYNPATGKFVAFKNSGSGTSLAPPALSAAQLATLGSTATAQANIVNYLRGNSTLEQKNGGGFRNRDWPLGDIVDSQPVYESPPNANEFVNTQFAGYTYDPNNTSCTNCSPFQDWAVGTTDSSGNFTASAASKRTSVVWVAGNDGMLHAFNSASGNEVYAYLPGALMINSTDPDLGGSNPLANLADPSYGGTSKPHQYYNDGELTVADAYVQLSQTGDTTAQWHSILVGTTGRGPARAVYALDVTDPTNVTPLWERYAGDSSSLDSNSGYIGQVVGKPVIAQTGDYGTTPAWSVLIGNGYNSQKGIAALLQFNLATGQLYVHTTTDSSDGLAAPLAWMDYPSAAMSDVAYAGDLSGNVWGFPLITVSTSNKGGNTTTSYAPSPSAPGVKLFTATDSAGKAQPITAGMWGAQIPSTSQINPNSVWLFFGTGKYLTQTDITDASVQSWYGIMAQATAGGSQLSSYSRTSSSMIQRNIIAEQPGSSSPFQLPARAVTQPNPTTDPYSSADMKGKNGWFMDLESPSSAGTVNALAQGERIVAPNQLQGNLLIGTTRIPKPAGDITDPCNPAGSGWIMAVNPFSGTGPITNFFDTNNDGMINGGDTITVNGQQVPAAGVGFTSLPNAPIFVGGDMLVSFDNGTTSSLKTQASSGGYSRVSWQELVTP